MINDGQANFSGTLGKMIERLRDSSPQLYSRLSTISRRDLISYLARSVSGGILWNILKGTTSLLALDRMGQDSRWLTSERIAATPTYSYRAYRSKRSRVGDATSWIQIDLGRATNIDGIRLYPANQNLYPYKDEYYAGQGFPVRFAITASDQPTFNQSVVIVDYRDKDFANPRDNVLSFATADLTARYVRITITRFPEPACGSLPDAPEAYSPCDEEAKYWFSVAKISVISNGADVATNRPVSSDPVFGNPTDHSQVVRPDRIETEYVRRDRPSMVTDASTWVGVRERAFCPRSGVKLEGGLFETAIRNNIAYLLGSFTVDDLLLQFRQRAKKPIPASRHKPDPFWETDLAGSNAGRFLMGAGNTLRWINDPELRHRLESVVDGIAECRQADGYIMGYPEDTIFYSERGGYTRAWVTHGLIEAGFAGSGKAFALLREHYDWFNSCAYLPALMRGCIQGGQGMIANTRLYFTPVGKPTDIQVIQRYFLEADWLDLLGRGDQTAIWQYPYDRPHCYLLTNLEAYLDVYRATGEERWHKGVKAAWEMYKAHWQQAGGSISIIEFNYDPPNSNSLTQRLGELCGSSFWTFLTQRFQMMSPEEEQYAAEIEKSIYNVALANQDGGAGFRYHTVLVGQKEQSTHVNTCCEGQGTRLIGSLPEHIFSLSSDGIYVNLFEPASITWKHNDQQVSLKLETLFPFGLDVAIRCSSPHATPLKLRVRVPSWASTNMQLTVNEEPPIFGRPGSYVTLDRVWSEGDRVKFVIPASFKFTEYKGTDQIPSRKRYSLTFGPILFAAVGSEDAILRLSKGSDPQELINELSPIPEQPLHFRTKGNSELVYMPYWQVTTERFTCFPVIMSAIS